MKLSLKNKIALFLTLTVFAISAVCTYLFISAYTGSKEKELIARGTTLSYSLSRTAEEGLIRENLDLLQKASYIVRAEDVVSVQVYSSIWDAVDAYPIKKLKSPPHAEAVRHFEKSSSPLYIKIKDGYDFYNPVIFYPSGNTPNVTIGYARVVLSSKGMQAELKQLLVSGIAAAVGITLLAIAALNAIIGRLVLNPITKIYKYVSMVKEGDLPAANAPARATRRPAPLTKSKLKGKNPPIIGTKRTPPPTPPRTATMPSIKVTIKSTRGHIHHGVDDS
jgi:hypothetical protein